MDSNCRRLTILFTWVVTSVPTMGWTVIVTEELGLARTVFQMLKKVWSSIDISSTTKLKVYKTQCVDVQL